MGLFDGADTSSLTGGRSPRLGDYPGKCILKVVALKAGLCEGKKRGRTYFAAEFEIVKSNNPTATPGSRVSWAAIKNPEWPDFFFSDVKRLIGAIVKQRPESIKQAHLDHAVSDAQPARGRTVQSFCSIAIKDGKNIAVFDWGEGDSATDLGPMIPVSAAPAGKPVSSSPAAIQAPTSPVQDAVADLGF